MFHKLTVMEPSMEQPTPDSIAGIKYAALIAAFAGSAISLRYAKELTKTQAALSFATGGIAAIYVAPLIVHFTGAPDSLDNAVIFATGLVAMRAIPALLALVDRLKDIQLPWLK
jgi:hypothetical protein